MSQVERPKAELVATVLERLADDRYYTDDDEDGELIVIPDYGETFPDREGYFSWQLSELKFMRDGSEDSDSAFDEDWSDFWTRKLLERLDLPPVLIEDHFSKLKGKTYEEVINNLYEEITGDLKKAEGLLAAGRETIPKTEEMELSRNLDEGFKGHLHERLASFHARRLSRQFPKIVDRAVKLALLTPDYEVPTNVKRYMEEASKSYLNGQFIACLMVCRSAIEFSVRDRLQESGHISELDEFEKGPNGDS